MQHNLSKQIKRIFHWHHLSVSPVIIVKCLDVFLKGWETNLACVIFYWRVHSSANLCSITATNSFRAKNIKERQFDESMNPCLHTDGYSFANVWCFGDGDFFIDSRRAVMAVVCCMSQMGGGGGGGGFVMNARFSCRWLQSINTVICCW